MNLSGKIIDGVTGKPLANVTIWEIPPGGTEAFVSGTSDSSGSYLIDISGASSINFVTDGYTGVNYPSGGLAAGEIVSLFPVSVLTGSFHINIPSWFYVLLGLFLIALPEKKKRK